MQTWSSTQPDPSSAPRTTQSSRQPLQPGCRTLMCAMTPPTQNSECTHEFNLSHTCPHTGCNRITAPGFVIMKRFEAAVAVCL